MYCDHLEDHVMAEEGTDFKKKRVTTLRLKAHETAPIVPRHTGSG